MISIRYNNEIVDILPNQQLERTMNNPMFLIDNILAEYSTPFTIVYSERNVRNFGMFFFDLSIKKKEKFEVQVLDQNSFAFNATLVIETAKVDRRVSGRANANGYLLSGISKFLTKIKDVKANTLLLGGERTLPYTTGLPTDGTNGYVQQFQNTWNNTDDYIVAPIRNDQWLGEVDDPLANGWMNILDDNGNLWPLQAYVLQPRVKFVLECLFLENGWVLDSSGMAGTDWENIFLFSVKPLFTADVTWEQTWVGDSYVNLPTATVRSEVKIHLAEWISPEVTCSDLLIELCKKYGWVPLCNNDSNICRLIPLKYAKSGIVKDWTKYASGQVDADFSGDPKVYAFKNIMPFNDTFPSVPSFENLVKGAPVLNKAALPSPLGNYDNTVIYSYQENQWWKIDLDPTTNQRIWVVLADNIYDEDITGATETFETKVSTLPMYRTKYRTSGGIDYYGLFAFCKQSRNKEWGLRTLVYHGLVYEVKADGTHGPKQYPYLSSIRVLPDGTEHMNWSNVLRHIHGNDDYGIIEYWFQSWMDLVGLIETDDQRLFLPIHVLYNFRWDDIINIFNVPYLVKSYIEPRAYPGYIQAKLQRLTLDRFDAEGAPAADIYLKMVEANIVFTGLVDPYGGIMAGIYYSEVTEADWIIEIYTDAAGTIPTLPTVPLTVNIEGKTINDDNPIPAVNSGPYQMNVLGQLLVLGTPYTLHDYKSAIIHVPPSYESHFTRSFRILPGTGYKIIS